MNPKPIVTDIFISGAPIESEIDVIYSGAPHAEEIKKYWQYREDFVDLGGSVQLLPLSAVQKRGIEGVRSALAQTRPVKQTSARRGAAVVDGTLETMARHSWSAIDKSAHEQADLLC